MVCPGKEFRKDQFNAVLIYISNHESYLKELFEVDTFRFLSKPITLRNLKVFRNAVENSAPAGRNLFSYSYDRQFFKVLLLITLCTLRARREASGFIRKMERKEAFMEN